MKHPGKSYWKVGVMVDYARALRRKKPLDTANEIDVKGKIIVITGADSGIGAAAALQLAKRGARLVMPTVDMGRAVAVAEDIRRRVQGADLILVPLDLGDLASVRACASQIRAAVDHIDILINNAGIVVLSKHLRKSQDGFETNMAVNHLGPFLLTNLLLDLVKNRILFTSSLLWQFASLNLDDLMCEARGTFRLLNSGPYSNSKLANMYTAHSLAKRLRLEGTGVNVYALCPGIAKTNVWGAFQRRGGFLLRMADSFWTRIWLTPEQGASTLLYCALSKGCAQESGLMYRCNGVWDGAMEEAVDEGAAEKLWEISEKLVASCNK